MSISAPSLDLLPFETEPHDTLGTGTNFDEAERHQSRETAGAVTKEDQTTISSDKDGSIEPNKESAREPKSRNEWKTRAYMIGSWVVGKSLTVLPTHACGLH